MDKQQIIDFLVQVAEVKQLKPAKSASIRLDETHIQDVKINGQWTTIDQNVNPSLGVKIVKLKDRHAVCELGCGDIVTNQVIEKRLNHYPEVHWRTRCVNCGCYPTPDGEGFVENHVITSVYLKWFKEQKAK